MPSHWGHNAPQHRVGVEPDRHAGAAGASAPRKPASSTAASPAIPDRESQFHADEIVFTSLGEGATSEGEFWEALNTACTRQLPVLFLVEDNGYAISVPVEVQTPGGDISRLVRSFPGLHVDSIDGTDFFASLRAMREAAAYVRARKGPAFVHARVIRPYSHSLSDDEKLYKTPAEREAEARRDPIARFAEFLQAQWPRDRRRPRGHRRGRRARGQRGRARRRCRRRSRRRSTAALWVYSPDVDPTSAAFDTPAQPEGKPDTMVGGDQPHAEGRNGAQPAHRRLRRGRRGREPEGGAGESCRARAASSS